MRMAEHAFRQTSSAETTAVNAQGIEVPLSAACHAVGPCSLADVHWLSLKAGLDGLILPSKFYGIAAAARPIIVIGSPNGELSRLAERFDCGFHVGLGQSEDLARIIVSLAQDRERCCQMGLNARRMLEERFTKAQALDRWHAVLRSVADGAIAPIAAESRVANM